MTRRVLVLGGTGAIGVYLVEELLKFGYRVDVTSRSERSSNNNKLRYLNGDGHNLGYLKKVIKAEKYDSIVDFMNYSTQEFETRYQVLLQNCDHYIFLSSYRVFAESSIINENSPKLLNVSNDNDYLKTDEYALAKARQEDLLRRSSFSNWTIVRPAITYSKARFQLGTMEAETVVWRALRNLPVVLPIEMLNKQTTMTWAGDVARLISKLVLNNKAYGEDYNIATSENNSWKNVAKIYESVLGLKYKTVGLDAYIEAMGGGFNKYQINYDRMFNRILDNSKILHATAENQKNMVKLSDGLKRELEQFTKTPVFRQIDYAKQARIDKLTHTQINLSDLSQEEIRLYQKIRYSTTQNLIKSIKPRTLIKSAVNKFKSSLQIRRRLNRLVGIIDDIYNKHQLRHVDGAIVTLTGYYNYGNVVQRYALQKFLKKNGHNYISYVDPFSTPRSMYKIGRSVLLKTPIRAIKRFFNYQKPYWYIPKYSEIYSEAKDWDNIIGFVNNNIWIKPFNPNDSFKSYIVGSDQVWRDWWNDREVLGYYFFNFLKGRKVNRIAYAASFGKDSIKDIMRLEDASYIQPYLEQFDSISVREKSGKNIIKDEWGISNVQEVVDPTLLLEVSDYNRLIDNSSEKYTKIQPIFSYILGETPGINDFLHSIQNIKKQSTTDIRAHSGVNSEIMQPVELWLKGFRDSKLVVTNSFHGLMLSVINNTDFIIIGREVGGLSRIEDFLKKYSLEGRLVLENSLSEFEYKKLKPIDWKKVNNILDKSRKTSQNWLLNAVKGGK